MLSVQEASKNLITEIIVVDNNSTDESCAMIHSKFPKVNLITNKKNIGFSKANNLGVEVAKGEFILILNPDTVLAEDTIDKTVLFAERKSNYGAIGVKFIDGTGNFLPECKRNIPTLKIAGQKIRGNSKNYYANHIGENEIAKAEILSGAFMLMNREVYVKVGGFDEDYFMFGEDVDLSYKLLNNGFQNYYFGENSILHYKGESTVKDISYLQNFYSAMHIFYRKHFKINILYKLVARAFVWSMIHLRFLIGNKGNKKKKPIGNLLFVSDNNVIYQSVKNKLQVKKVSMNDQLPEYANDFDMVIYDNSFISYKDIINNMHHMKLSDMAKRIIPKGTSFFIGSDSSVSEGEVVEF